MSDLHWYRTAHAVREPETPVWVGVVILVVVILLMVVDLEPIVDRLARLW